MAQDRIWVEADRPREVVRVRSGTWTGDGLRIVQRLPGERAAWDLDVYVHGQACAEHADGIRAITDTARAVSRIWLGDEHARWHVGQHDVAVDVSLAGCDANRRVTEDVFAGMDLARLLSRLVTRASPRMVASATLDAGDGARERGFQIQGTEARGRTVYAGRWLWYEKDRTGGHKRAGLDLPATQRQWRAAGWNGTDRVIRFECRTTREDLNGLTCDGAAAGATDLDTFACDGIWWQIARRHADTTRMVQLGRSRRRRADLSPWWREIVRGLDARITEPRAIATAPDPGDRWLRALARAQIGLEEAAILGGDDHEALAAALARAVRARAPIGLDPAVLDAATRRAERERVRRHGIARPALDGA